MPADFPHNTFICCGLILHCLKIKILEAITSLSTGYIIGAIIVIAILSYLLYSLIKQEIFKPMDRYE